MFAERAAKEIGPLSIGDRVSHFVVRAVLGEGGTAVVYEAVHTRLNASVALKVVDMRSPYGPTAAARLQREAELCAAIDDPHVPKVYDVGQLEDGTPFIVMEKVSGPTLESLLSSGALNFGLACAVLRDLLLAVEAVQRAGIVHRDIKPSNVIVQFGPDNQPNVRLMDFGVSRSLWLRQGDAGTVTRRGTITGTPEYMAPEQIHGQPVDARTDVYALGIVAYEMLAGRPPFSGDHPTEVITAVLRREYADLVNLRPDISPELALVIARAMECYPNQRFANAEDMRTALDSWAGPAPTAEHVAEWPAEEQETLVIERALKRRAWPRYASFAIIAALGLYAWPARDVRAPHSPPVLAASSSSMSAQQPLPTPTSSNQSASTYGELLPLFRENLAERAREPAVAPKPPPVRKAPSEKLRREIIENAATALTPVKSIEAEPTAAPTISETTSAPSMPAPQQNDVQPNPYEE